jgi:hypothetical protein
MTTLLRRGWLWFLGLMVCTVPSMALADQTVHASGFLKPFLIICVVIICVIGLRWMLRVWAKEIGEPLVKILDFAVIIIAVIIILIILLGLAGINIT